MIITKNTFYTIYFLLIAYGVGLIHAYEAEPLISSTVASGNEINLDEIENTHFAVISIPKSGTHLLLKLLSILTNTKQLITTYKTWYQLDERTMHNFLTKPFLLKAHIIHINENIMQINKSNIKTCFLYRDPRAQIVSSAFFIVKELPVFAKFDLNVIIDKLITEIDHFYHLFLPWQFEPYIYTTTFEKLIGENGGGSQDAQLQEIIAIANHVGVQIDLQQALDISKQLFGGTPTFREGQIDSWKKYFLERHKEAFKNGPGQKLLELLGYEKDKNW